jgi:hypothetical protein
LHFPLLAGADSHFQLWKVYVGMTNLYDFYRPGSPLATTMEAKDIRVKARSNIDDGVVLPDKTPIASESGVQFGVGYYVRPQHTNFVSFDLTWLYPHLKQYKGADHHTEPVVHRKTPSDQWPLKLHVWDLTSEDLIDGDLVLSLHNEEHLFLRHIFEIRGCNSED